MASTIYDAILVPWPSPVLLLPDFVAFVRRSGVAPQVRLPLRLVRAPGAAELLDPLGKGFLAMFWFLVLRRAGALST